MNNDMLELQIAAKYLDGRFSTEGDLTQRLTSAMRAVKAAPESDVFWFTSRRVDDDLKFRTAIAAVMLQGNDEDRDTITRSMRPLQALSAAMSGVPVDFESVITDSEGIVPLMHLWHEAVRTPGDV